MTVLVRDQATGEYNEPHVHRHGQLLITDSHRQAETCQGTPRG